MEMENKILIDVTDLTKNRMSKKMPRGIDRVTLAYLEHFQHKAQGVLYFRRLAFRVLFSKKDSITLFSELIRPSKMANLKLIKLIAKNILKTLFLRKNYLQTLKNSYIINLTGKVLSSSKYWRCFLENGSKPVIVIHDLIPITHPELCDGHDWFTKQIENTLNYGAGIISVSQASANSLINYAKKKNIQLPSIIVSPLASTRFPKPSKKRPILEPYFVVIGTIELRKNQWSMLLIWKKLVESLGTRTPKLVIIGERGSNNAHVLHFLNCSRLIEEFVIEKPFCLDSDLSTYLYHAQALLFPTFTEGYGLPLVESLELGTPIIASNLPVFHEIAGDIPEYLDPIDGLGWMEKIKDYAQTTSASRQAQIEKIRSYTPPTWSDHFDRIESFLDQLSGIK